MGVRAQTIELIGGSATVVVVSVGYYIWHKRKQAKKKKKLASRKSQKDGCELATKKTKK